MSGLTKATRKYLPFIGNSQFYPISYGVELQFLIPVIIVGKDDPHPDDSRKLIAVPEGINYAHISEVVKAAVLHCLRGTAHVPSWTYLGPPFPTREDLNAMDNESAAVSSMTAYSQWVVETDEDLLVENDAFSGIYTWVGVKVKSSKRDISWENHFDQIYNVIVALRSTFRIRLPPTTSLMIHVGEKWHDIMAYEAGTRPLRVFCTMWWLLERYVQELAHPSRSGHPECQPLKTKSRLARMSAIDLEEDIAENGMSKLNFANWYKEMHAILPTVAMSVGDIEQLECLWRSKNGKEIVRKMTVPRQKKIIMQQSGAKTGTLHFEGRGSVGFQGICEGASDIPLPHNDGHTGTVEFRSMEGTLDPLLIVQWLAVVTRLVDFARRGNTIDLMGILEKGQKYDGSYSGLALLQDLGLPEQYEYFKSKVTNDKNIDITKETQETLFLDELEAIWDDVSESA
ncbi:hypothetical protein K449DRAFT_449926 [Hypoxylon sp. EC38]|nr:hypothetical protein K449DRAFT_449926 [Hypoxylon sp. EC38]